MNPEHASYETVLVIRQGLQSTIADAKQAGLFDKTDKNMVWPPQRRDDARAIWGRWCDYYFALDSIAAYYKRYDSERGTNRSLYFDLHYGAFLTQYRFALEFLSHIQDLGTFDVLLNEAQVGLPERSLARFKFRYLNVKIASEFVALDSMRQQYRIDDSPLTESMEDDRRAVWSFGAGKGELMTLANGLKILTQSAEDQWFPIQKGLANAMGDTRVRRGHDFLIDESQLLRCADLMQPGDIMIQRREWYMSNLGIPGYWTHAALYLGTAEQREQLSQQPEVMNHLGRLGITNLNQLIPKGDSTFKYAVVEAIGEGVSLTDLMTSGAADSMAVLRPTCSDRARADAIARALTYLGRPYDYRFDFDSDTALVCSELVFKAYQGYVSLELEFVAGKKLLPPNNLARIHQNQSPSPFSFVLFLDGDESRGTATFESEETFSESWKRPKWHIVSKAFIQAD